MAAKLATGRQEIVVLRHSYSGRSATALSSTGHSTWRPLPARVAGIVHARAPYCYRCPLHLTTTNCGLACAEDVEKITREHGGLFIADEVQTGCGRTGEKWFDIEHWDLKPDLITSAKGIEL